MADTRTWKWAAACSIGTSHVVRGGVCEDSAACTEIATKNGQVLISIVSDGAGSAASAKLGSRSVCLNLMRILKGFLKSGGQIDDVDDAMVQDWLARVRTKIQLLAQINQGSFRDYAATLVCVIMDEKGAVTFQVGDGASVLRMSSDKEWFVPAPPDHGEYINTTSFVTNCPFPNYTFTRIQGTMDGLVMFSDGIERIVLENDGQEPFQPFFNGIIKPLDALDVCGRDRKLSRQLCAYLDGSEITDKTDDDKTLILAARC